MCPHASKLPEYNARHANDIWQSLLSRCVCCGGIFPYMNEISIGFGKQTINTSRVWLPRDKCSECGGDYHHVAQG